MRSLDMPAVVTASLIGTGTLGAAVTRVMTLEFPH
jgi:hypothetical protein